MMIDGGPVTSGPITAGHGVVWIAPNILGDSGGAVVPTGPQTANFVFAGPLTGVPAAPTFRKLGAADINGTSGITLPDITITTGTASFANGVAQINNAGTLFSSNSGVGVAQNTAFGITNNFHVRGFSNNDYCEVSANGNVVRLAAPGGGGGNWTVVSERAKKKDLAALPGDPFAIINAHSIEIGRYLSDPADAPLKAFLFYEDAIVNYPYATVTMPERLLHDDFSGEDKIDPAFKGLSQEAYVPLLMRAMQLVDQRLKAGGL